MLRAVPNKDFNEFALMAIAEVYAHGESQPRHELLRFSLYKRRHKETLAEEFGEPLR